MRFTDAKVRNLKAQAERYEVWADKGLGVRVSPKGTKTWVFLYRFGGKPRRMTLGTYPCISVADAHQAHGKALFDLERGIDPGAVTVVQREEERRAPTVAHLVEEYLEQWAKPRKRSWKEDERILNKDVTQAWGKRKAGEITRRDVVLLLDDVKDRGAPIQSNRTLAVVRRMFNFAVERGILDASPVVSVKAPAKEQPRERVLTADEIRRVWHGFDSAPVSDHIRLALRFMLVTGQRKGEVIGMEWSELDPTGGWWTLAGAKVKNGRPHRVPLSGPALAILEELQALRTSRRWVFPSPRSDQPITGPAVDHAVRRCFEPIPGKGDAPQRLAIFKGMARWTPHDLRRTVGTILGELGFNRLIQDKVLNHVDRSVGGIYDRHTYDNEKRRALEAWARRLEFILQNQKQVNRNVVGLLGRGA